MTSQLMEQVSGEIESAVAAFKAQLGKAADLERLKRKELLSAQEVEALYGFKVATLETWRCRGGGPDFVKIGASVFYTNESLGRFIEERRVLGHE